MGERVVGLVGTGRVPKLRRIADDESGCTKFTLEHTAGLPAVLLLWAGPGEQADHAWLALELVALAFAPPELDRLRAIEAALERLARVGGEFSCHMAGPHWEELCGALSHARAALARA